ncbi:hypothetical protein D3C75_1191840 [compost metagenome]
MESRIPAIAARLAFLLFEIFLHDRRHARRAAGLRQAGRKPGRSGQTRRGRAVRNLQQSGAEGEAEAAGAARRCLLFRSGRQPDALSAQWNE